MKPTSFQKKSAKHIVDKLFINRSTNRFLLADEPGLGKTIVAREVVRNLYEEINDHRKTCVVYICSNMGIIDQNVRRLLPEGVQEPDESIRNVRLTMWPIKQTQIKSKLQVISFTPGTSLYMSRSTGIYLERIYLLNVFKRVYGLNETMPLREIFRGTIHSDNRWHELIEAHPELMLNDNHDSLINRYRRYFDNDHSRRNINEQRLQDLRERVKREGKDAANDEILQFLRDARTAFAMFALLDLKPDLIILDEFQNFREVLKNSTDENSIVGALLDKPDSKLLMSSATPYRMYTTYEAKPDEEHYKQFSETLDFLNYHPAKSNGEKKLQIVDAQEIKKALADYRKALFDVKNIDIDNVKKLKKIAEQKLKEIMLRTERISFISTVEGGIEEIVPDPVGSFSLKESGQIQKTSLLTNESLTQVRDLLLSGKEQRYSAGASLSYWKSGSYLLHVMGEGEYELTRKLGNDQALWSKELREELENDLPIALANHQLEYLQHLVFDIWGHGERLWLRPSCPYIQSSDPIVYNGKILIFSHWRFVPRYISFFLSKEASRRAKGNAIDQEKNNDRASLLQFQEDAYSVLFVSYPSYWLAQIISSHDFSMNTEEELISLAEKRLKNQLGSKYDKDTNDPLRNLDFSAKWLRMDDEMYCKESTDRLTSIDFSEDEEDKSKIEYRMFFRLVEKLTDAQKKVTPIFSSAEVRLLAEIAVRSPAVSLARSIINDWPVPTKHIYEIDQYLLRFCFTALRRFFDRPLSRKIIRKSAKDEGKYWEDVLIYCYKEEWQAVIDEYCHLLGKEHQIQSIDWPIDTKSEETAIEGFFDELQAAMGLRPGQLEIRLSSRSKENFPRHLALAYEVDQVSNAEGLQNRPENIRFAFNSPFYPFVLATTTVGQEGIDFHRYCGDIMHWNLPSNPVDLEQREGRINRHSGLIVRRNIAQSHRDEILNKGGETSIWQELFNAAERDSGGNPLSPYWIYAQDSPQAWRIRRHVILLPFSRDRKHFQALKKTLAFYRLAFGQPRQVDLVDKLMLEGNLTTEQAQDLYLDLQP